MRLRNITGSREVIAASDYVVHEPNQYKGKWNELFGNHHPIRIEIGMGKGRFIMDLAKMNPDINYVGIEKYSSVLLRGFGREEVDRIYLNFSDPWPKDRHAKRRLPSREFLHRYDEILARDGVIEFKTDNHDLFQFALEELEPAGWRLDCVTEDLHHNEEMMRGNVMTEYEEKFSSIGNPIYKYIISR